MRIYDIGANVGKFTESNVKKYTDCEFILVEANPKLCEFLNEKFKNFNNIKIINKCVSNVDDGYVNFYISESDTISTAVDSLIKEYGISDYFKIDVEGYEKKVICCINNYIGLISFEWAEESKKDILESILYLRSIGYTKYYLSYSDEYTFIPVDFYDYDSVKIEIESLDENRKEKWGMIFAK